MPLATYNKTYGGMKDDNGYSVVPAKDGGLVMAGTTASNNGDVSGNNGYTDAWVIKTDADGNKIWQQTFGGAGYDSAFCITATSDGGFAIAGSTTSSDGSVASNHGTVDAWVIKIDAGGKLVWQKTFGGSQIDVARSIVETTDGGLALSGYTNSADKDLSGRSNSAFYDMWILKLSGVGNLLWQKTVGGTKHDFARSIIATADGGVAVAGETNSSDGIAGGNHGSYDMLIIRLGENGNLLWTKTLGGYRNDYAAGIVTTIDSGFVIAGSTYSNNGNISGANDTLLNTADACLVKIDRDAKIVWIKTFGGSGNDGVNMVIATSDYGFLLAGRTDSNDKDVTTSRGGMDAWVVKVGAKGNKLWQQSVGGSGNDMGFSVAEVPRKGYIMTGSSSSNDGDVLFSHGGYDVLAATFKSGY